MLSWMGVYVSIFVLAGIGVAFFSQLGVLRGKRFERKDIPSELQLTPDKRNAFSWMAFFSLTLAGWLIPIVASILGTIPNNPLPEIIFCLFYVLGPFLILRCLGVNKETGRIIVIPPPTYAQPMLMIGWVFARHLLEPRSLLGCDIMFLLSFAVVIVPLSLACLLGVSIVLIISILPPMLIFSKVLGVTRAQDRAFHS